MPYDDDWSVFKTGATIAPIAVGAGVAGRRISQAGNPFQGLFDPGASSANEAVRNFAAQYVRGRSGFGAGLVG
jgi:hypothetical protein